MFVRQQYGLDDKDVKVFNMDYVDKINIRTLSPNEIVIEFHINGERVNHVVARYRTKREVSREMDRFRVQYEGNSRTKVMNDKNFTVLPLFNEFFEFFGSEYEEKALEEADCK